MLQCRRVQQRWLGRNWLRHLRKPHPPLSSPSPLWFLLMFWVLMTSVMKDMTDVQSWAWLTFFQLAWITQHLILQEVTIFSGSDYILGSDMKWLYSQKWLYCQEGMALYSPGVWFLLWSISLWYSFLTVDILLGLKPKRKHFASYL